MGDVPAPQRFLGARTIFGGLALFDNDNDNDNDNVILPGNSLHRSVFQRSPDYQWRVYREAGGRPPSRRKFLSENLELVGKFERGYLTIFRSLRSQKTFRTRNVKNWTFVHHRDDTILR